MGYCTSYELEIKGVTPDEATGLIASLQKFSEDAEYALCDDGSTADACKWYDHEKDMREFTKLHPDALFILSGEGEEAGDIWKEYYKGGKCQRTKAEIKLADYDESLLK